MKINEVRIIEFESLPIPANKDVILCLLITYINRYTISISQPSRIETGNLTPISTA